MVGMSLATGALLRTNQDYSMYLWGALHGEGGIRAFQPASLHLLAYFLTALPASVVRVSLWRFRQAAAWPC